ncbi:MAG: 30S ribosomal protein S9 [Candidatus Omnitrophota bacterium]|nr:30S ribosomal protein S9 [Candidatus Omnitrophota bacterium]
MEKPNVYRATGRRKESVAKVRIMPGSGNLTVNSRKCDDYFVRETDRIFIRQPLNVANSLDKFDCVAQVCGGGISGQAGALRHALSRVLLKVDEALRPSLRKGGFLTRDPRMKERKKYGRKGARKRFQWTKR